MSDFEIRKAHCNNCGGIRNHRILYDENQRWEEVVENQYEIYGEDTFTLLKCEGCESITLLHEDWFSEATDEQGHPYVNETYYPPAISRPEPRWLHSLRNPLAPEDQQLVWSLLNEIYRALHNNCLRLAVMGARALLEQIMLSKVEDQGTFGSNLDAFEASGHLSRQQRASIEPILEAGHAAIHRGFNPTTEDVNTVIDVTESIVESTFVHTEKVLQLASRVPPRQ